MITCEIMPVMVRAGTPIYRDAAGKAWVDDPDLFVVPGVARVVLRDEKG